MADVQEPRLRAAIIAWAYWVMMSCNLFIPQVFWIRWCRQTPWFVLIIVTFVNVGMWYERFVIIVQSLHHDFLPGSWGQFYPTWVDWLQMIGDFGLFFTLHAAVHPLPADDRDRRGEGRAADGQPATPTSTKRPRSYLKPAGGVPPRRRVSQGRGRPVSDARPRAGGSMAWLARASDASEPVPAFIADARRQRQAVGRGRRVRQRQRPARSREEGARPRATSISMRGRRSTSTA